MENNNLVGKYVIVKDLLFSDFMKEHGKIKTFDTIDEAMAVCGMYEFPDVLVMKIECNYKEAVTDEDNVDDDSDEIPYCTECGSEDLAYLEQYANGNCWKCKACDNKFIW